MGVRSSLQREAWHASMVGRRRAFPLFFLLLAPSVEPHRHIRAGYEASVGRCTNGVTAPGDVIIRLKHAVEPEANAPPQNAAGGAGLNAAARFTARLMASRGNGRRLADDVEIKATLDSAIDAVVAHLSEEQLNEVRHAPVPPSPMFCASGQLPHTSLNRRY